MGAIGKAILSLLFSLLLYSPTVLAQTGRQVAQKAFPSTVLLSMLDKQNQPISLGSGFFVGPNLIVTNLHVIEGAAAGTAKLMGEKSLLRILGSAGVDGVRDLALLSVAGSAPPLTLSKPGETAVGDEVFAVGNPQGLEGTFSQGIVSGLRRLGADTLLQITAPFSPGSSGGPVLNTRGEVVGVAVATFLEGQNLNFAVPSSYVQTLLSNMKPLTPLPVSSRLTSSERSIEGLGGPKSRAVVATNMLWLQGGNYSFSVKNNLAAPVTVLKCVAIFFDRRGEPIHVDEVATSTEGTRFKDSRGRTVYSNVDPPRQLVIPAGLAKRCQSSVSEDIRFLAARTELRVLDFRVVE